MKVKCPNCGFRDEGSFRSHCGMALPKLATSSDPSHTIRHFVKNADLNEDPLNKRMNVTK